VFDVEALCMSELASLERERATVSKSYFQSHKRMIKKLLSEEQNQREGKVEKKRTRKAKMEKGQPKITTMLENKEEVDDLLCDSDEEMPKEEEDDFMPSISNSIRFVH